MQLQYPSPKILRRRDRASVPDASALPSDFPLILEIPLNSVASPLSRRYLAVLPSLSRVRALHSSIPAFLISFFPD